MSVKLKICGVLRPEDVEACHAVGVDAVGINLWPGSRRYAEPAVAQRLVDSWPVGGPARVGVFVDPPPEALASAAASLRLDAVQLHGERTAVDYASLIEDSAPPWVWVVRGTPCLDALDVPRPRPSWALLDAAVPGYGGAGHKTDWGWAADAVRRLGVPTWLAGGITPDNAVEALREVRPVGLDVASGAESEPAAPGHKDPDKIAALARICKNPVL